MPDLTEEKVRQIAKDEVSKTVEVDIHKIAKKLSELQKHQIPRN